jgi:hypothetical protein
VTPAICPRIETRTREMIESGFLIPRIDTANRTARLSPRRRQMPVELIDASVRSYGKLIRRRIQFNLGTVSCFYFGSLDYLSRSRQHIRWNRQADLFCSLEINDQLDLRRLLHRQVSRLGPLQDSVDANKLLSLANKIYPDAIADISRGITTSIKPD